MQTLKSSSSWKTQRIQLLVRLSHRKDCVPRLPHKVVVGLFDRCTVAHPQTVTRSIAPDVVVCVSTPLQDCIDGLNQLVTN